VLGLLVAIALAGQPPAWIQRAKVPPPIVAGRLADVLGTPVVEGIAVDRDSTAGTLTISVVDSRFDPPRIVRQRALRGSRVRWLRAGTRDGLARSQIAVGAAGRARQTGYLLRVGRRSRLDVIRTITGRIISPRAFSR
jgi:hypothetical protein